MLITDNVAGCLLRDDETREQNIYMQTEQRLTGREKHKLAVWIWLANKINK